MAGKAKVTFFHHSGFSVAVEGTLLVFDYWRGEDDALPPQAHLREEDLQGYDRVIFFVSHEHPDHFDKAIYDFERFSFVDYVISADMSSAAHGDRMAPGDTRRYGDVTVQAFASTDLGVCYYVDVDGLKVFHAGDLNLWHWREESTLRWITQSETLYYACVEPLLGKHIDLCMFPVDPRMGGMYEAGANHFIMALKPRVFIPMHWFGRTEVATDFARRCRTKQTEGLALTKPRELAEINFSKETLSIHVYISTAREDILRRRNISENMDVVQQALQAFDTGDPFSESDLPVNIDE